MRLTFSRIQHLSTTEYPGSPCCVVHTCGCPLACIYCSQVAGAEKAEVQQLVETLEKGKALIDAVAIAGCEPLKQEACVELAVRLRERGFRLKIHTTGYYPDVLERLAGGGIVDFVELEIKAPLDTGSYAEITGREDAAERVLQSLEVLSSSQVRCGITATLAPPVFSHEAARELAHELASYGFSELRLDFPRDAAPRYLHHGARTLSREVVG